MNSSQPHIGLIALDRWRGGAIRTHNLVRALSRLPATERPRITLFCRSSAELFEEVASSADKVVVYESMLDKIFGNTRFDVYSQRLNSGLSAAFRGEAMPKLARAHAMSRWKPFSLYPFHIPACCPTRLRGSPIFNIAFCQSSFRGWLEWLATGFSRPASGSEPSCGFQQPLRSRGRYPRLRTAVQRLTFFTSQPCRRPHGSRNRRPSWPNINCPSLYVILCNQFWIHKDHLTAFKAAAKLKREGLTGTRFAPAHPYHNRHPNSSRDSSLR